LFEEEHRIIIEKRNRNDDKVGEVLVKEENYNTKEKNKQEIFAKKENDIEELSFYHPKTANSISSNIVAPFDNNNDNSGILFGTLGETKYEESIISTKIESFFHYLIQKAKKNNIEIIGKNTDEHYSTI